MIDMIAWVLFGIVLGQIATLWILTRKDKKR